MFFFLSSCLASCLNSILHVFFLFYFPMVINRSPLNLLMEHSLMTWVSERVSVRDKEGKWKTFSAFFIIFRVVILHIYTKETYDRYFKLHKRMLFSFPQKIFFSSFFLNVYLFIYLSVPSVYIIYTHFFLLCLSI